MINLKRLAGGVAFVAVAASLTPAAFAQVTTSGVQGTVAKSDGTPAGDATVTVEDTRNGLTRTVVTTPTGAFDIRGLNVGGPYTVSIAADGEQTTRVSEVFLALGSPTSLNLAFSGSESTDVIIITATQAGATPIATGPAATFSLPLVWFKTSSVRYFSSALPASRLYSFIRRSYRTPLLTKAFFM